MNLINLSKIISHALRHEPHSYGLVLDKEGWTPISSLLAALANNGVYIERETIVKIVEQSTKKRHQILNNKIRAYYGHSIEGKIEKYQSEPPEFLYHGTLQNNLNSIKEIGLLPMDRQYVHLSIDEETARVVGSRRKGELILLKVKASEASRNHIQFYEEENGIWLSDTIPSKYIIL